MYEGLVWRTRWVGRPGKSGSATGPEEESGKFSTGPELGATGGAVEEGKALEEGRLSCMHIICMPYPCVQSDTNAAEEVQQSLQGGGAV